jgi:Spy/CpxP family protein refolding chaperone
MKTQGLVLGLILISSVTFAQSPEGGKSAHKGQMRKELGLTDEQVQQMREIRESGGSRKEAMEVLTPEQQAQAQELRKKNQGKRGGRMQQHLGLDDEQMAEIEEIKQAGGSREDIRAVLTPEQQAQFDEGKKQRKTKKTSTEE